MAYPANTDYPVSVDVPVESRIDNIDIVWDDDFNFQAKQHEAMQKHIGPSGGMIADIIPGDGISGAVSAVASGGIALRMLARASFSAGTLWSLEDNYDVAAQQKMRVNYAGRLWTADGADFSNSEYLEIPHGNVLPITFEEGRLFRKDDTDELYHADGSAWVAIGGGVGSFADIGMGYSYTEAGIPIEEVVGQKVIDGSLVGGTVAYFTTTMTPTLVFTGGGEVAEVRLYDLGPKAGPPAAARLVATLSTLTTGGPQVLEGTLTVVPGGVAPNDNKILDSARMYEVRVTSAATVGDMIFVGSVGIEVR
jgi:hypothetical protein